LALVIPTARFHENPPLLAMVAPSLSLQKYSVVTLAPRPDRTPIRAASHEDSFGGIHVSGRRHWISDGQAGAAVARLYCANGLGVKNDSQSGDHALSVLDFWIGPTADTNGVIPQWDLGERIRRRREAGEPPGV